MAMVKEISKLLGFMFQVVAAAFVGGLISFPVEMVLTSEAFEASSFRSVVLIMLAFVVWVIYCMAQTIIWAECKRALTIWMWERRNG